MSFLADIINAKKRKILEDDSSLYRQKKWVKRGELEEQREKEYWEKQRQLEEERMRKEQKLEKEKALQAMQKQQEEQEEKKKEPEPEKLIDIPREEVFKRLRQRGEPIILFGETDLERAERLRKLEIALPLDYQAAGFGSDFVKILRDEEEREETFEEAVRKVQEEDPDWKEEDREPTCKEEKILFTLRRLYREWVEMLDARPEAEKKSAQGRLETVTARQTKQYLKPFLRLCRTRRVPEEILKEVDIIIDALLERNYVKANDAYYRLAIGNAPWPMGVTMVGIHERSAREKISSSAVAHILNDETQRKYIQAIKRLMTFAQKKYPAPPSLCVN